MQGLCVGETHLISTAILALLTSERNFRRRPAGGCNEALAKSFRLHAEVPKKTERGYQKQWSKTALHKADE